MAITAALVKELRETTGAGMMDCKKALSETDGNLEASVDWLRTKGLAAAAKKAEEDRIGARLGCVERQPRVHPPQAQVALEAVDLLHLAERMQPVDVDLGLHVRRRDRAALGLLLPQWSRRLENQCGNGREGGARDRQV